MPATVDDLQASLQQLNNTMNQLLQAQRTYTSTYRNRRWNFWTTGPRRLMYKGISQLLTGRPREAMKSFGQSWRTWKAWRGFGKGTGIAGSTMAVVTVLNMFRHALIRATDAAVASARHYAEVSPSAAAAVAQRDIRELLREREKGERVSSSAQAMMEAEQFRKDQHKEIDILGDRVGNFIVAGFNVIAGVILEPVNRIAGLMNDILDKLPGLKPDELPDATDVLELMERNRRADIIQQHNIFADIARDAQRARFGI